MTAAGDKLISAAREAQLLARVHALAFELAAANARWQSQKDAEAISTREYKRRAEAAELELAALRARLTAAQPQPAPSPLPCDPQHDLPAQTPLQPRYGRIGTCGHCRRPVGWGDAVRWHCGTAYHHECTRPPSAVETEMKA